MTENRLPNFLQNEAMGDLSGIKGTYYHFVYALYLLLSSKAQEIAFYAGNDLLSHPPAELDQNAVVGLKAISAEHDEWIQLKNTNSDDSWTLHRILTDKTLFPTFLLNALFSEYRKHSWTVHLISPALIRSKAIHEFLNDTENKSTLMEMLEGHIVDTYWQWNDWLQKQELIPYVSIDHVRHIANQVLEQIASCEIVPVSQVLDRIKIALLEIFHDSTVVTRNAFALRGALMEAGNVPSSQSAVVLSIGWMERKTNLNLRRQDLLSIDPLQACQAQVEKHLPNDWNISVCAPRHDLLTALQEFIASNRTLFILTGDSGSGKSWASAYYASYILQKHIRIRISGSLIPESRSLTELISHSLRSLARPDASDEEISRILFGAASRVDRSPFIIIADDIPLTENADAFAENLEHLCQEAHAKNVKLILIARQSVWQRISSPKHLSPYLYRHTTNLEKQPNHSYQFTTLASDEIKDILDRRLPSTIKSQRLALQLKLPQFAPLRNLYLLSIYIDQTLRVSEQEDQPRTEAVLDIDNLLDQEIEQRFGKVILKLQCDWAEMEMARIALVQHLWQHRRTGSRPTDLIKLLEDSLPNLGRKALMALQVEDILTSSMDLRSPNGTVTYSNPQFGDRVTALWIAQQLKIQPEIITDLEPGFDDSIMTSLVRKAINLATQNPLLWSQNLLEHNPQWLNALAQGIAQRQEDNWQLISMLSAWANHKVHYSTSNSMRALGTMAVWSGKARGWIAKLYADEQSSQRFKGQIAIGTALDVVPNWVKRRVALRLRRDIRRDTEFPKDNKTRATFLRGALYPLQYSKNKEAAVVAKSLLEWLSKNYQPANPFGDRDIREQHDHVVDIIRGQIAMYGNDEDLQMLQSELSSENLKERLRAVRALSTIAQERPERIRQRLFAQARQETEILQYFLQPLIHYTESDPDDILDIIQQSNALGQKGCGLVLVLLGEIAKSRPQRVRQLLPLQLDNEISPDFRAILSGLLSLTWWHYTASVAADNAAYLVLEQLSTADYTEISDKYRCFATHGAAVAIMARMSVDIPGMSQIAIEENVYFHHLAMELGVDVLYTDFHDILRQFPAKIATHPLSADLMAMLIQSVNEYKAHEIHPIEDPYCEWQFRIANVSTDCIAALAVHIADPTHIVQQMPRNWPALRVCKALLEAKVINEIIIQYGCKICSEHANVWGNVSRDRDKFIQELRKQDRLPVEYSYLATSKKDSNKSAITHIDTDIALNPEVVLDLLHSYVSSNNVIPFLWDWSTEASDWKVILLGSVFRAMFSENPLSLHDCKCFEEQVLATVAELPNSPLVEQYKCVYSMLQLFSNGEYIRIPEISFDDDLLSQSHKAAMEVIKECQQSQSHLNLEWFRDFVASRCGWAEDDFNWLSDGTIHSGNSSHVSVYFPPALRIALTIASLQSGITDLITDWLQELSLVRQTLTSGACETVLSRYFENMDQEDQQIALVSALSEVDSLLQKIDKDASVWHTKGHLLLLAYRFEEAKQASEHALKLSTYRPETHTWAYYNLACSLSRLNDAENCNKALKIAIDRIMEQRTLYQVTYQKVIQDPDFVSVRNEVWFLETIAILLDQTSGN